MDNASRTSPRRRTSPPARQQSRGASPRSEPELARLANTAPEREFDPNVDLPDYESSPDRPAGNVAVRPLGATARPRSLAYLPTSPAFTPSTPAYAPNSPHPGPASPPPAPQSTPSRGSSYPPTSPQYPTADSVGRRSATPAHSSSPARSPSYYPTSPDYGTPDPTQGIPENECGLNGGRDQEDGLNDHDEFNDHDEIDGHDDPCRDIRIERDNLRRERDDLLEETDNAFHDQMVLEGMLEREQAEVLHLNRNAIIMQAEIERLQDENRELRELGDLREEVLQVEEDDGVRLRNNLDATMRAVAQLQGVRAEIQRLQRENRNLRDHGAGLLVLLNAAQATNAQLQRRNAAGPDRQRAPAGQVQHPAQPRTPQRREALPDAPGTAVNEPQAQNPLPNTPTRRPARRGAAAVAAGPSRAVNVATPPRTMNAAPPPPPANTVAPPAPVVAPPPLANTVAPPPPATAATPPQRTVTAVVPSPPSAELLATIAAQNAPRRAASRRPAAARSRPSQPAPTRMNTRSRVRDEGLSPPPDLLSPDTRTNRDNARMESERRQAAAAKPAGVSKKSRGRKKK